MRIELHQFVKTAQLHKEGWSSDTHSLKTFAYNFRREKKKTIYFYFRLNSMLQVNGVFREPWPKQTHRLQQ